MMVQKQEIDRKKMNKIEDDGFDWYAVRLFTTKQDEVVHYFEGKGLECFVPMSQRVEQDENGRIRKSTKPVVRNIVFVKQTILEVDFKQIMFASDLKMSVMTIHPTSRDYYRIPHAQMYEFRLLCNPELGNHQFLSSEEANMKTGDAVYVKHGPLKGLTGRLVRSSKKYYLLKEIPGIGIMTQVSRWCCVPLEAK